MRPAILLLGMSCAIALGVGPAQSEDLYKGSTWSALATDHRAARPGDSLTVVVYENSTASNSTQNGTRKTSQLSGQLSSDARRTSGALDLSNSFQGAGQVGRAQQMLAQISVVVDEVLPNGDLRVSGAQNLTLNGEPTSISVRGRVRPQDVMSDNSVLSTRLADAEITYDGTGFVAKGARPGVITRALGWLGLP